MTIPFLLVYTVVVALIWRQPLSRVLGTCLFIGVLTALLGLLALAYKADKDNGRLYNVVAFAGLIGAMWAATGCAVSSDQHGPIGFMQNHLFDYIAVGGLVGGTNWLVFNDRISIRMPTLCCFTAIAVDAAAFEVIGVDSRLIWFTLLGVATGATIGLRIPNPIPH